MPATQVTQGLIIYDDFSGYSNDSLADLLTSNWSNGASGDNVGQNILKFSTETGVVRTDAGEANDGLTIFPVNSTESRTEMVVAAEISLEGGGGDTNVGLIANAWGEEPLDSYVWVEFFRNTLSGQTRLNVGLRRTGSIVFQNAQSIGTYTNPYNNPVRLKVSVTSNSQEVWYDNLPVASYTRSENSKIPGISGMYHNDQNLGGGYGTWDNFYNTRGNTWVLGGLPVGYKIALEGQTLTSTNGTVTFSMGSFWFPFSRVTITNQHNKVVETLDVSSSATTARFFGGDVYRWSSPSANSGSWTTQSFGSRLPWWILWHTDDSTFSDGVDYELRFKPTNHLRISDETARTHRFYDSVISNP